MAAKDRKTKRTLVTALMAGAAVCAYLTGASAVFAQESRTLQSMEPRIPDDAKLVLTANELVYNRDAERITAVGGVQINYAGYKMVAQRVEYDQKSGRMTAIGNIELIEPGGNRIYADTLDVTDNFADGFINALRVETTDNTRLIAESGERVGGNEMILNNGIYTACLPCAENPDKPPLWQIRAERVVQNGQTQTIRLEKARFELFGHSIATLPVLEMPDHTVKRKSGFLFPTMKVADNLGFGLSIPYYYVINKSADLTVTGTGYTTQGFLLEGEYRQRLENGTYTLRAAGINQMDPGVFRAGTSDAEADGRGMIATTGQFKINPRWAFGWDGMLQTDSNFARTYSLKGLDSSVFVNQVYLTGLGNRNYFDMRAFYFDVQDACDSDERCGRTGDFSEPTAEGQQPIVYPSLDYQYIAPSSVYGGELSFNMNLTNLSRNDSDVFTVNDIDRFRGLSGNSTRLVTEMEWKRQIVTPGGLVLTPLLAARGDVLALDVVSPNSISAQYSYPGDFDNSSTAAVGMLTAGLEASYPVLMTTNNSSHLFEPIAQIFVRPNEQMAGGLPNEDAQSFVFDGTTLFERDKFSGYDRIEGGTRANLGIRYSGTFDSGYVLHGVFGQSYHLAGENSFDQPDLVYAGANSGLDSDVSDFVGMAGVDMPNGFSLGTSARFDKDDFSLERTDALVGYRNDVFQTDLIYTQIAPQPLYRDDGENSEIQSASTLKFAENWSVFGAVAWDINNNLLSRRGIGLTYEDECMIFSIVYSDKRDDVNESASDWTIGARITFRTLGDINVGETRLASFN
ncbi:LPS-assembly protein LptD [Rhizobiaceae bacterium n13]|uniref:LPS-assembly protein LptD n=1 Tax=Ferirhizobium litorale TaxID=2927786 RepID=A0AAE3QD93_9HYPH|nr:LPS-assembly protein LptD [Fererhizobium litorale]MDI7861081.1 LPS-assembly protein LptD [Fererhizobium litorale]MDI7921228.1 LPS-assembly protein LptD [Fererhizobium litorale]